MQISVRNPQGEIVGEVEVSDALFGVPMNQDVVHQALVRQRANARAGTASTKKRGEVRGGGRKPWRQKGTGRARSGSIRNPLWRGGGTTFGPKPRSYRQAMPKKMRRLALRCCISDKVTSDHLIVIDGLRIDEPNTKAMALVMSNLGLERSTLLVTREPDVGIVASAKNIQRVKTLPVSYLNVVDLLSHQNLVITLDALRRAEAIWADTDESYEALVESEPIVVPKPEKPVEPVAEVVAEVEPEADNAEDALDAEETGVDEDAAEEMEDVPEGEAATEVESPDDDGDGEAKEETN